MSPEQIKSVISEIVREVTLQAHYQSPRSVGFPPSDPNQYPFDLRTQRAIMVRVPPPGASAEVLSLMKPLDREKDLLAFAAQLVVEIVEENESAPSPATASEKRSGRVLINLEILDRIAKEVAEAAVNNPVDADTHGFVQRYPHTRAELVRAAAALFIDLIWFDEFTPEQKAKDLAYVADNQAEMISKIGVHRRYIAVYKGNLIANSWNNEAEVKRELCGMGLINVDNIAITAFPTAAEH